MSRSRESAKDKERNREREPAEDGTNFNTSKIKSSSAKVVARFVQKNTRKDPNTAQAQAIEDRKIAEQIANDKREALYRANAVFNDLDAGKTPELVDLIQALETFSRIRDSKIQEKDELKAAGNEATKVKILETAISDVDKKIKIVLPAAQQAAKKADQAAEIASRTASANTEGEKDTIRPDEKGFRYR